MMQLNSYRNKRYWNWLRARKNLFILLNARSIKTTTAINHLLPLIAIISIIYGWHILGLAMFIISYIMLFILRPQLQEKKPLIFTARAKRIYIANILLLLIAYIILLITSSNHVITALLILVLITWTTPLWILITNTLLLPLEILIIRWYFNDAQKRRNAMTNLKVIGITGSFGKTTTKYVLHEILRHKYNTLMSPGSFNTPMGISKIIRTQLKPTHEILIAELSAKQPGDIAELCALTKPQFGILSAIGKQHLETFGSLENIKKTKNELIECLPDNGIAFFNMDDPICRELANLTTKKSIYYGIEHTNLLHYRASNIQTTDKGSTFTVGTYQDAVAVFTTKLLGKHNIYNILAAISVAAECGVSLNEMMHPIKQLQSIPHRLELKRAHGNITIIDDTFNSNPVGSKMALDVLASIFGARKIIVTPGMIELGNEEYALNKQFGKYIANNCDYVILVGKKQTQAIQDGLVGENFSSNKVYVAHDFFDAKKHLHSILQTGDVVLFENDLPDSY